MKKNELVKSVNLTFNRIGFQLQKKSPEILVVAGVVGVVVSAVMACTATPKALKVAEKTSEDIDRIQNAEESGVTQAGETYTQEDARNDRIQVYSHTGFQYVKLYAPAILLGAASITCILTSHKILRKRNSNGWPQMWGTMRWLRPMRRWTSPSRIIAAGCWSALASRWRRNSGTTSRPRKSRPLW